MVCLFLFPSFKGYKNYIRRAKDGVRSFIVISKDSIIIRNSIGKNEEANWSSITDIKNKPKILAIYTDSSKRPIGITKRSFHSELEAEQFIRKMKRYWDDIRHS